MNITQLQKGERAVVLSVGAPEPLKERLRSLNIRAGGEVRLLKISPFRRTFLLQCGSMVAVRREVAEWIEIRKL